SFRSAALKACATTPSEEELQYQFHRARRTDGARNPAEVVRGIDVARRRTKARVVQQIERFRPELEVAVAARFELLREHGIDVVVAWRPRDTSPAVPPGAKRHARERIDVQPMVDVLIRWHGIADAVRPLVAADALLRPVGAVGDGDRETGARLEHSAEAPPAHDRVDDRRRLRRPRAAAADGQFI